MKKKNKSILILPRWYPNKTDVQLGIFIQRQLILMHNDFNFYVVYAQATDECAGKFEEVTNTKYPGLTEHIVYFKNGTGLFRKLINFRRYRKAQKTGISKINTKIDACHVHVPYRSAMPALNRLKKQQTPMLITEHWSGHLNGQYLKKNALDQWLYKRILGKAAKISTVSKSLQAAFKKNTGFDSHVIPNYIEQVYPSSEKENNTQIKILSVGDLHDETKGFIRLLEAFSIALKSMPNLQLTIVGGGPDEEKISKRAKELGLPDKSVLFTGRQTHDVVLNTMTECDFYICNSRYETFGMTVAEALLAGKPVICTRCGGPEEFLTSFNSLMIDTDRHYSPQPENDQLLEAILTMAGKYTTYDNQRISDDILAQFGKKAVHQKWLDFYTI